MDNNYLLTVQQKPFRKAASYAGYFVIQMKRIVRQL